MINNNKRSWCEINLQQLKMNYQIYKLLQPVEREIMAVVKADAYGHGDLQVSKLLQSIWVNSFAVSNSDEACRLRENGIEGLILILGYTPVEEINVTAPMNSRQVAHMS